MFWKKRLWCFSLGVLVLATALVRPTTTLAEPAWEVKWKKIVAAARKEGKIVMAATPIAASRKAITKQWAKDFPEIKMHYTGARASVIAAKIAAERRAGLFHWDVFFGYAGSVLRTLKAGEALDNLHPLMILPEVNDDSKWFGGRDYGFIDRQGKYLFNSIQRLSEDALINRDFVSKEEVPSDADPEFLKDPKFKGKIGWFDPRVEGTGLTAAYLLLKGKGEEWLKDLFQSGQIVFVRDSTLLRDWLVSGRTPIAIGTQVRYLRPLQRRGLAKNVNLLYFGAGLMNLGPGCGGSISLLTRGPHPNAARVFLNWFHTREFQQHLGKNARCNSRRLDVKQYDSSGAFDRTLPASRYIDTAKESYIDLRYAPVPLYKKWIR